MQALARLGKARSIILVWILGHQGIQTIDALAKLGTQMDPAEPVVGVPFAVGKKPSKASRGT